MRGSSSLIAQWAKAWGLPGLEFAIEVRFDPRLRRALGRCQPTQGRIGLHAILRYAPAQAIATVLCHEAAHVAAYQLHGRSVRAHGDEWRALVLAVGEDPSRGFTLSKLGLRSQSRGIASHNVDAGLVSASARLRTVAHRCPICQTMRMAVRAVPAWRCAECVGAGLDGRLIIGRPLTGRA